MVLVIAVPFEMEVILGGLDEKLVNAGVDNLARPGPGPLRVEADEVVVELGIALRTELVVTGPDEPLVHGSYHFLERPVMRTSFRGSRYLPSAAQGSAMASRCCSSSGSFRTAMWRSANAPGSLIRHHAFLCKACCLQRVRTEGPQPESHPQLTPVDYL